VATYAYRCARCGPFDLRLPIGDAPAEAPCPACGHGSRRVFTPPALARTPREVAGLREREEASQAAPEVVTGPLPGRPMPPLRGRLPRP
jgi:putative FmdB family regulatory protein